MKSYWRLLWIVLCFFALPSFAGDVALRYACGPGNVVSTDWHVLGESDTIKLIEDDYRNRTTCWIDVHDGRPVSARSTSVLALRGISMVDVNSANVRPGASGADMLWRSARAAAFTIPTNGVMLIRLDVVMPIGGSIAVDVEPTADFLARDASDVAIRGALLALLLAMSLGGVLYSVAMRNGTMGWYAGLTFGLCLMWSLLMGMAVSPTGLALHAPSLSLLLLSCSYGMTLVCAVNFARRYNHLPQHSPFINRGLIVFCWGSAIYATLSFVPQFSAWAYHYFNLLGLCGMLAILLPGFVSIWARDYRTATLYMLGWLPLVLAWAGRILLYVDRLSGYPRIVVLFAQSLRENGMLPDWLASPAVRQTALLVQAAIFLLALADQTARTRRIREAGALSDKTTGLANRAGFLSRAGNIFDAQPQQSRTVLLLDIARFSTINEVLGYESGDIALREAGQRLQKRVGSAALVARVGANQFALLLEESSGEGGIRLLIGGLTRQPIVIDGNKLDVSLAAGFAIYPDHGRDAERLLRCAEIALAVAKREKQVTTGYSVALERDRHFQLSLLSALRTAVVEGQLQIYLQPKVSLSDGRVCGAEALLRWLHPTLGLVAPSQFLPFAEQTGLIVELTRWALEQSFVIASSWHERKLGLRLSVNLSALDVGDATLPARVADALGRTKADPDLICLELTESELLRNPELAISSMKALRTLKFHLSLDDFGTGHSTLRYLQDIPVNEVKIDRSFMTSARQNPRGMLLLESLTAMCHSLQLRVIAEGAETESDWRRALAAGCDEVQGYYIAQPMPVAEFEAWLLHNQPFMTDSLAMPVR